MKCGIILAAGKGSRMKVSGVNKTALSFEGKPMVSFGVDLLAKSCEQIFLVVGAFSKSITELNFGKKVEFVIQRKRLGTGHALKVAVNKIRKNNLNFTEALVGYGDHMMFYPQQVVDDLLKLHKKNNAAITMISTTHDNPNSLAWGRVVRKEGKVVGIVEQKDANENERNIIELNAGFYCFDWGFLVNNIGNLTKSSVSGEYYLTELIKIACDQKLGVEALTVPFEHVGVGINTKEQLEESIKIYRESRSK